LSTISDAHVNSVPMLYVAEELIEEAINRFKNSIAIACSFGKDSMVVSHMARKFDPDILHVKYAACADFPETRRFTKQMVKELKINLVELPPYKGMGYWKCIEKYGLPTARTSESGKPHAPFCCYYLKEMPMKIFIKENSIKAILTGLTAGESWNRYKLAYRYSKTRQCPALIEIQKMTYDGWSFCAQRYWAKSWASWQIHPLMTWTGQDIWDYTYQENIPVNPVYTKWGSIHNRVGCLACTAYLDWERNLRVSHPKLYQYLKKLEGKDKVIQTAFTSGT